MIPWDKILAVAERFVTAYEEDVALKRDQIIENKKSGDLLQKQLQSFAAPFLENMMRRRSDDEG